MISIFPPSGPIDASKYQSTDGDEIDRIEHGSDRPGLSYWVYFKGCFIGFPIFADGTMPSYSFRIEPKPDPLAELAKRVEALEQQVTELSAARPAAQPAHAAEPAPWQRPERLQLDGVEYVTAEGWPTHSLHFPPTPNAHSVVTRLHGYVQYPGGMWFQREWAPNGKAPGEDSLSLYRKGQQPKGGGE